MHSYLEKCEAIIAWAKTENPNFCPNFVLDVKHDVQFFSEDVLSVKQKHGIDRIISNYKIDLDKYL